MPFDTPIGRYRYYLEIKLKWLECGRLDCHTRFKQNSPAQKFCSYECANISDPLPPRIQQIFDEYRAFTAAHGIPSPRIVQSELWAMVTMRNRNHGTIALRSRVANHLKLIMDRFRRGFYVLWPDGVALQVPPWQPFCPIDRTHCTGAILPGSCPRRERGCVYSFTSWQLILETRGYYEIDLGANGTGNFDRRSGRPVLGYDASKRTGVDPRQSDRPPIRQRTRAKRGNRKKTGHDNRVQANPDSV